MPSCAEARPGSCPCCGAAAQPVGGRLAIVGHGVLVRQVRGPAAPGAPPEQIELTVRRYRCRACRGVLVVGPRGLLPRRWYAASAIALALATFGRGGTTAAARAQVSPSARVGGSATERWVTLARWIEAARRGELFGVTGLDGFGRRRVAEQVVLVLAARAGHVRSLGVVDCAFVGAGVAA